MHDIIISWPYTASYEASPYPAVLYWDVARSSRARFFVCFIAPRSCRAEPRTSAELPDATKQTKDYTWQLLARPRCRLAFSVRKVGAVVIMAHYLRDRRLLRNWAWLVKNNSTRRGTKINQKFHKLTRSCCWKSEKFVIRNPAKKVKSQANAPSSYGPKKGVNLRRVHISLRGQPSADNQPSSSQTKLENPIDDKNGVNVKHMNVITDPTPLPYKDMSRMETESKIRRSCCGNYGRNKVLELDFRWLCMNSSLKRIILKYFCGVTFFACKQFMDFVFGVQRLTANKVFNSRAYVDICLTLGYAAVAQSHLVNY